VLQVRWITFHSGYDFGYLLKVLTCQPLPQSEADFFELLKVSNALVLPCSLCFLRMCMSITQRQCPVAYGVMLLVMHPETATHMCCWLLQIYFPTVYDIKYLMKFCDNLHGGLNKLAESLEVNRMGPQHQVSVVCHVINLHSAATLPLTHFCDVLPVQQSCQSMALACFTWLSSSVCCPCTGWL
jgi:hypothetical protein